MIGYFGPCDSVQHWTIRLFDWPVQRSLISIRTISRFYADLEHVERPLLYANSDIAADHRL